MSATKRVICQFYKSTGIVHALVKAVHSLCSICELLSLSLCLYFQLQADANIRRPLPLEANGEIGTRGTNSETGIQSSHMWNEHKD